MAYLLSSFGGGILTGREGQEMGLYCGWVDGRSWIGDCKQDEDACDDL